MALSKSKNDTSKHVASLTGQEIQDVYDLLGLQMANRQGMPKPHASKAPIQNRRAFGVSLAGSTTALKSE
jgi:hypothetical protein